MSIEELQAKLELAQKVLQKQRANREKYKQTDKGKIAVKNAKTKYRNKTKTLFFKCVECDCMIKLSTKCYHYNRSRKHKKALEQATPPNTPHEEKTE